MRKYFGTDGVRGKANIYPMTSDFALKLGQAVAKKFLGAGAPPHQVVIGKDTRVSCYMFESALVAGLCSQGIDAVQVGVIPTPAVSFLTKTIRANAGIMISASHNPYYDNGIKVFSSEGLKLSDDDELEIEEMIENGVDLSEGIGRAFRIETAIGRYVESVKTTFDKDLDLRGLKIVVDCANGACYKVGPMAIEELGAKVIVINNNPNGININDNAGATAPQGMRQKVIETGADLGLSFDGDGDRMIVCDSKGNIIDGDMIMGICGNYMKELGNLNHNTLVATVMSNQGFVNSMKNKGIDVVRSNVGDRYVMEAMVSGGYNLGGEQSGHVIFSDYVSTGDGLVTALQLLKVIVKKGRPLCELSDFIHTYPQILLNINVASKPPLDNLTETSKIIKQAEQELGLKGRILVRYSGTESKARVMAEGEDQMLIDKYAHAIADSMQKEIK